ncbi:MAG TPA: hypothetical protein VEC57_00125 [Candidatus Limnocylindrales bacterium]|nr:hypothetical protein [Candidatus Limnocylindrales bacterium]
METYVLTSFWLNMFVFVVSSLNMSLHNYPRTREVKLGGEVATAILALGFMVWCALLLWIK